MNRCASQAISVVLYAFPLTEIVLLSEGIPNVPNLSSKGYMRKLFYLMKYTFFRLELKSFIRIDYNPLMEFIGNMF